LPGTYNDATIKSQKSKDIAIGYEGSMADVNGTANADFIRFIGSFQNLTFTMVNPYSGESIEIDAEFLLNSQSYDGLGGFDYLLLGNTGDALFLDGSSHGGDVDTIDRARSIQNIEFIIAMVAILLIWPVILIR
jgi:hypothetical protein